jgi:hypothetical protein
MNDDQKSSFIPQLADFPSSAAVVQISLSRMPAGIGLARPNGPCEALPPKLVNAQG